MKGKELKKFWDKKIKVFQYMIILYILHHAINITVFNKESLNKF